MKKMIMALVAALTITLAASAQDDRSDNKQPRPERKEMRRMDPQQMAAMRTERAVERYGLNEQQAAQLLELNKQYAGKMMPQRGPRGQRPDSVGGKRPMKSAQMGDNAQRPERNGQRPQMRGNGPRDFGKQMEAYDAEIKKIFTDEQYKKYKADQEERRSHMRRHEPRKPLTEEAK